MGNPKKSPAKGASTTPTAVAEPTPPAWAAESLTLPPEGQQGGEPVGKAAPTVSVPATPMSLEGDVAPETPGLGVPTSGASVATPLEEVAPKAEASVLESLIPDMGDWNAEAKESAPAAVAEPSKTDSATDSPSAAPAPSTPKKSDVVIVGATDCIAAEKPIAPPSVALESQPKPAPAQEEKHGAKASAASTVPERPPLFAAAWDLEEEEPTFPKRWRIAAWVAAVVGVVCVALYWGARVTPWSQYLATVDVLHTEPVEDDYSLAEAVQDDAELYRDRKPYHYNSVRDAEPPQERVRGREVGQDGEWRGTQKGAARGPMKGARRTPVPAPEPVDETARAYAMLGGGYNAAELTTAEPAPKAGKAKVPQIAVRGAQLQGRLEGELTSHIGTPVIVKVTADARLGRHAVPSGAELHGLVSGSTYGDARIFARFDFILFEDGSSLDFAGIARDVKGRPGIPGAKLLDGESAKSVGIAGLGGMIAGAGQMVGGFGGIIAGGAERAADSASAKAERIDRDDLLIVAEDATPVAVYVQSVGDPG